MLLWQHGRMKGNDKGLSAAETQQFCKYLWEASLFFSPFLLLRTSALRCFVDRTIRRQDCRESAAVLSVYLFVSLFGRRRRMRRRRRQGKKRNLMDGISALLRKTPCVNKDTDFGERAWERQSQKPWEIVRRRQREAKRDSSKLKSRLLSLYK